MLSARAKYGIKAMIHIAERDGIGGAQSADIAEAQNIPKKFLDTILLELKNNGLLHSKKGRGGGYNLTRPPAKITVGQIAPHSRRSAGRHPLRERRSLSALHRLRRRNGMPYSPCHAPCPRCYGRNSGQYQPDQHALAGAPADHPELRHLMAECPFCQFRKPEQCA